MNAQRLLQHFDRISEAPDAIPRLRRFILDLAVRGKLVKQDPNDEPAAELLKRIQTNAADTLRSRRVRSQDPPTALAKSDEPFEVPATWIWARFGALADFSAGRTPSRHDGSLWNTGDYPWVSIADMQDGGLVLSTRETISAKAKRDVFASEPVPVGTVIMSFKLTIGKISRLGVPAFHNEAIISIRPYLSDMDAYLFKVLPQFSRQGDTKDAIKGATLNRKSIANICLPIPPLAEQHRIVAKVDELMTLCDQLEAAKTEREQSRDRLIAASLHRLNQSPDIAETDEPEVFRAHALLTLNNLPRLTSRPAHIKQLRLSIRNLAMRGKLVPQNPSDEPVTHLLKRIQAEQAEIMGRPPDAKMEMLGVADQKPFELPAGWQWVRFADLICDADSGWSPRSENFPRSGSHWGVLKVSAVSWDQFRPEENKQLLPGVGPPKAAQVRAGDFLISRANTSELVAKCVIVEEEPRNIILSDKIVRLRITESCSKKFLCMVNNHSEHARTYYAAEASGTSLSMKNVSRAVIYELAIPLPSLAEQHRIVAKVDLLMALCDQLEAQLTTTEADSRRLLEAVLHEALAPVAEEAA